MGFFKKNPMKGAKKPEKNSRIIGIAGAGRGTGVTHMCILTANYMASALDRRTALIQWNDHGGLEGLREICLADLKQCTDIEAHKYKIFGVTYYTHGSPQILTGCLDGPYEETIIDFGELRQEVREDWLRCSVQILMGALCEWKLKAFLGHLAEDRGGRGRRIYMAAFGSEDMRKQIERRFRITLIRVPFSADAFSVDRGLMEWFDRIL